MSDIKNGGPAFPIPLNPGSSYQGHAECDGMTMRDYFAAKAMQGVLSNFNGNVGVGNDETSSGVSACAYAIADAMLKEREK